MTIEDLKTELKETVLFNHIENNHLASRTLENIVWALDNWDIDFSRHHDEDEKPAYFTKRFSDEWIDHQDLYNELEYINDK